MSADVIPLRRDERPEPHRTRWIDTAEAAKRIRQDLKQAFPGLTFSVRIQRYSGGSHVTVSWEDGPTVKEVEAITGRYAGQWFDGMDDSTHYIDHYLYADGRIELAPEKARYLPVPAAAELVSFGCSSVHTSHDYSPTVLYVASLAVARERGVELTPKELADLAAGKWIDRMLDGGNDYFASAVRRWLERTPAERRRQDLTFRVQVRANELFSQADGLGGQRTYDAAWALAVEELGDPDEEAA